MNKFKIIFLKIFVENTTSTVSLVAPASRIVKRRREKDLSKPMFKKPFDYGWLILLFKVVCLL